MDARDSATAWTSGRSVRSGHVHVSETWTCPRGEAAAVIRAVAAAAAVAAPAPAPAALQAASDKARPANDWAPIARVERFDHKPRHLRLPATLPQVPDA